MSVALFFGRYGYPVSVRVRCAPHSGCRMGEEALVIHHADLVFVVAECFANPRLLRRLRVIILKIPQLLRARQFAVNLLFVVRLDMADRLCAARIILIIPIDSFVLRFRIR